MCRGGGGVLASRVIWDRVRETAMADTTSVTGKTGYIAHSSLLPSHPHAIFKHSVLFVFLLFPSDRTDRLAGKAALTSGLLLGRSEVLRSLRHYLSAQSQGHHTIDRLEERGVERGSARRSSFNGRERAIVNQTSTGIVSKATLGTSQETGLSAYGLF